MLKKICLFLIIFLLFFIIKNITKEFNQPNQNQIKIYSEKQILTINCSVSIGFIKKTLDGEMFLKDDKFRIFLYYNSDKKIDIGCNEEYFWYWSKKEEENTLFYSDKDNMDSVLKDGYSPSWMLSVFKNIENIGEKYNLNKNNKLLSTAEILPNNTIVYSIIEENIRIIFKVKNTLIKNFDESVFIMPNNFKVLNKMIPNN